MQLRAAHREPTPARCPSRKRNQPGVMTRPMRPHRLLRTDTTRSPAGGAVPMTPTTAAPVGPPQGSIGPARQSPTGGPALPRPRTAIHRQRTTRPRRSPARGPLRCRHRDHGDVPPAEPARRCRRTGPGARTERPSAGWDPGQGRPGRRHDRLQRAVRPLLRRRVPLRPVPGGRPHPRRGHHAGDVPARAAPDPSVTYQGRDIGAWFVTIARNLIFDHVKSSRYRLESTTSDIIELSPSTHGPEQQVLDLAHERGAAALRPQAQRRPAGVHLAALPAGAVGRGDGHRSWTATRGR